MLIAWVRVFYHIVINHVKYIIGIHLSNACQGFLLIVLSIQQYILFLDVHEIYYVAQINIVSGWDWGRVFSKIWIIIKIVVCT